MAELNNMVQTTIIFSYYAKIISVVTANTECLDI